MLSKLNKKWNKYKKSYKKIKVKGRRQGMEDGSLRYRLIKIIIKMIQQLKWDYKFKINHSNLKTKYLNTKNKVITKIV